MLNIEEKHLHIIHDILKKYPYNFYVFGSRITASTKKLSDLDLLYFDEIPSALLSQLEEDFTESDLPYKVDLVDYNKCDEEFKSLIGEKYLPIQIVR